MDPHPLARKAVAAEPHSSISIEDATIAAFGSVGVKPPPLASITATASLLKLVKEFNQMRRNWDLQGAPLSLNIFKICVESLWNRYRGTSQPPSVLRHFKRLRKLLLNYTEPDRWQRCNMSHIHIIFQEFEGFEGPTSQGQKIGQQGEML